jgi:creatinine amidohydrolase
MLLELLTWPEVETYLQTQDAIVLPIGSTEQHGPTGILGTDFVCAGAIARGLHETLDALVGPTIPFGMAEHHTGFPGTISLKPATLTHVVKDCVGSLAKHGFRKFFFVNGHGGNIAVLRTAFTEVYREGPQGKCRLVNWWTNSETYQFVKEHYGDKEGSHATPSEIALTMHITGRVVRLPLSPAPADSGIFSPEDFRQRYPDGRMGSDPTVATPEDGHRLYNLAVAAVGRQYTEFVRESG